MCAIGGRARARAFVAGRRTRKEHATCPGHQRDVLCRWRGGGTQVSVWRAWRLCLESMTPRTTTPALTHLAPALLTFQLPPHLAQQQTTAAPSHSTGESSLFPSNRKRSDPFVADPTDRPAGPRLFHLGSFVRCCVVIKTLTDNFARKDVQRTGRITLSYDEYVGVAAPGRGGGQASWMKDRDSTVQYSTDHIDHRPSPPAGSWSSASLRHDPAAHCVCLCKSLCSVVCVRQKTSSHTASEGQGHLR